MDIQEFQSNTRLKDFLKKSGFVLPKHEYSGDVLRLKSVLSDLRSLEDVPECQAKIDLKLNLENILTNGEPYIQQAINQKAIIKGLQAQISKLKDELQIKELQPGSDKMLTEEQAVRIQKCIQQLDDLTFISESNKSVVKHVIFQLSTL